MDVTWQRSDIHANLVLPDTVTVSWAYFSCCCDLLSVLGTLKCRKFHPENCLASGVHFRKVYSIVISNRLTSCYNLLQIVQRKVLLGFSTTFCCWFFFFLNTHTSLVQWFSQPLHLGGRGKMTVLRLASTSHQVPDWPNRHSSSLSQRNNISKGTQLEKVLAAKPNYWVPTQDPSLTSTC